MSPVRTKVESREARGRAKSVNALARKARLRVLALEDLEVRTLMATLPSLLATSNVLPVTGTNTSDGKTNDNNPSISVNPNNPLQLVATFGTRDANIVAPPSFFTVGARFSVNGGLSWSALALPAGNRSIIDTPGATPPTTAVFYTQNDDASVAWDSKNNFYILTTERNGDNAAGAVFLTKYSVAGGGATRAIFPDTAQPPSATGIGTQPYKVVYFWNQSNLPAAPPTTSAFDFPGVFDATIAVDNNSATSTDPETGFTQTDVFADRIHIAWTKDTPPPPTPPSPWNRYTIQVLQSANGGTTFSRPQTISGGNVGNQQYSSPRLTVSQQSTRTGITGGQVTVVYNDFGSGNTASPPVDFLLASRVLPNTTVSNGATGYTSIGTSFIGNTAVRGAVSPGGYSIGTTATSKGIGPGVVIAADNTLGSFSQFQGRLYVSYVDRLDAVRFGAVGGNQADNTDIFVKYSDNGGASWSFVNTLFGTPIPSNDDNATVDGYTSAANITAIASGTAFVLSGRPQFQPNVAVDQSTGTLILSYLDARDDASRARVVTSIGASIDGGVTFSPAVYANTTQVAVDGITGNSLNIGPIPENQSGGDPNSDGDRSYGNHQGLAVGNGVAYPIWAGDVNGGLDGKRQLNILTKAVKFSAGPRIIASTMGPVKAQNDGGQLYNNTFASDGTQQFTGFGLTFDRSIDPATFPTSAVTVTFQPANGSAPQNVVVGSIVGTNNDPNNGDIKWLVRLQSPQAGVGTYTYSIQPVIKDRIRGATASAVVPNNNPITTSLVGLNLRVPPVGTGGSGIPAQDTTNSPMTVSAFAPGAIISVVTVGLTLTHTFDSDLTIQLISPNNTIINLAQNRGGAGHDFTNTVFSDTAIVPIGSGSAPFTGSFIPDQALSNFNGGVANGVWTLRITDSFAIDSGFLQSWSLTIDTGTLQVVTGKTGNLIDQNADGVGGTPSDIYLNPKPLGGNVPQAPYDGTTLPIIVAGPHVVDTSVVNTSASFDNLVQNQGVSSIDVTFDRNMNVSSFDNTDVLRIVGPLGVINGPTTFQSGPAYKGTNLGAAIPDGTGASLDATLTIPSSANTFKIDNLAVNLSIAHTNVSDLIITLIAPDGTQVALISQIAGAGANLTNTTFDDNAGLAFSQGIAPFTNSYRPGSPLGALKGKVIDGKWTLRITDKVAGNVGTLTNWSLVVNPQITVTPVPVYEFKAANTLLAVNGITTGSSLTLPLANLPVGSGGNGGTFTIAALKFKASIVQPPTLFPPANGSTAAPLKLSLKAPDGTIIAIPNATGDSELAVSLNGFVGKSLAGTWTLLIDNPSGATSEFGIVSSWSLTATADTSAAADFGTPNVYESFRVSFPQQLLNGTYSVILGPNINALAGANGGDLIDNNQNAGLDRLRGNPAPGGIQVVNTYNSTAVPINTLVSKVTNGGVIQPGTISSTLVVNDDFTLQSATLRLNILFPNDPDLEASLTAPDGTVVQLFTKVGNVGPTPRRNFQNTVFDDSAATLILNGAPPFIGQFKPQTPLGDLIGKNARGTWTLTIKNYSATLIGSLTAWSLGLTKAQSDSGLGEAVADQTATSFRLFTMDPTNATSTTTWTAVGPAGIGGVAGASALGESGGSGVRSSRIGGLVLDPSDPSGNTVFLAGASGGVWKSSNFLTESSNGPTWIPLTDYGPTFSLNIGSLSAFGRNNDPKQTIVFAATGEGDTGTNGVGFLRSLDGGGTWAVLDSTVNVDASGNPLPINSPLRDHIFLGSTSFKIVVDPRPTPSGDVIIYAAMSGSGNQAGIWRSQDTGKTWTQVITGQATDVTLDPNSGTVDAISNPTGNLRILYAGLRGQGVFSSPNGGNSWNQMNGGIGNPLIRDADRNFAPPVPVNNPPRTPNGAKGRIVLAKPNLTGNPTDDQGYQGWLYAAVATPNDHLDGLYVTKDYGQNWTAIRLPSLGGANATGSTPLVPTNDPAQPDFDVTGGAGFGQANYDLSLVVDPNHPEVVYLGGSKNGSPSGLIRIDITYLQDAHAFFLAQNNADGGQRRSFAQGGVVLKTAAQTNPAIPFFVPPYTPLITPIQNFIRDPSNPFQGSATSFTIDTNNFLNTGEGARFIPWNPAVEGNTDQHKVFAFKDPLTGLSRFVFGYDQGVATAVDRGDGTFVHSLGKSSIATNTKGFVVNQAATSSDLSGVDGPVTVVSGGRNGNLQINQMYYGASQPSVNAGLTAQLSALFYFTLQDNGFPQSDPNILTTGNLRYTGGGGDGAGVATDQTGGGPTFHYKWPCCGGGGTDFFTVDNVGRTSGLIQASGQGNVPDPQWPFEGGSNFAVNPISPGGSQIIISSAFGNIFRTQNQGISWFQIAAASILDNTQANGLAYGAPDPTAPGYNGQTDNFIYVGTSGGHVYLSRTGGGSLPGSNAWTDISAGLDGSSVQQIVTNPARGSGEAFAITNTGVFYMADSRVANARWVNITGNLPAITHNPFGDVTQTETLAKSFKTVQADWRYYIPDNVAVLNGPAHPVLYVGGYAGVYRSFDKGTTWTLFPDIATNGSLADGGYLPNVAVNDLDLALGNINPTTGRPFNNTSGVFDSNSNPNILLASTYGRGAFAIRLAPIVFQSTVRLDPSLPVPGGSQGTIVNGIPKITFATPFIQGFSAQTAFGYKVTINLVDLTGVDLNDPAAVAAAATTRVIGMGLTDSFGKFSIQIASGSFTANGLKVIGVQAIDGSGTKGNIATTTFTLAAANLGLPVPPVAPTLALLPADNTGPAGQNITRISTPRLTGKTDANVTVEILDATNAIVNTGLSDAFGNYTIRVPATGFLSDNTYVFFARARNANGTSALPNPQITITIKTATPNAPTLNINPADDTGVKGDGITASRRPRLTGNASPGGTVNLYQVVNGTATNVPLATTIALGTGQYTVTLPNNLTNGSIVLTARAFDNAGNPSVFSPNFALKIVTVDGDYNNDGVGDLAVFRPDNANWYVTSAPGIASPYSFTTAFGATDPSRDVPIQGDFEGNGKINIAVYRPSTAQWFIQRPSLGNLVVQFGQGGLDIPVPADYDGDGVTDLAVWRPSTSTFYISYSSGGGVVKAFGWPGHDVPVPANYDGTGKAQIAVYRPETGEWFVNGVTGNGSSIVWGAVGDIPVPADYAGQGRAALAVYRPSTAQFLIRPTGTSSAAFTVTVNAGPIDGTETPVPLDYDGDGKVDPTIYRGSTATWYSQRSTAGPLTYQFGWGGHDIAIPGSYTYKLNANRVPPTAGGSGISRGLASGSASQQVIDGIPAINVSATTTSKVGTTNLINVSTTSVFQPVVTTPLPAASPTTVIRRRAALDHNGHHAQTPGGPRKLHATGSKGNGTSKTVAKSGLGKTLKA